MYNIPSIVSFVKYLLLPQDLSTHFHPCIGNAKDRRCGHVGRAFNISFTSGRDSISKVSYRGQEGPELFVNTRCFIHSISLAEGRGHDREICESVGGGAGYARGRRDHRGIAIFSFTQELISYRLDFPRRALKVLVLTMVQPRLVEILSENIYMIDTVRSFLLGVLDAYYVSTTYLALM